MTATSNRILKGPGVMISLIFPKVPQSSRPESSGFPRVPPPSSPWETSNLKGDPKTEEAYRIGDPVDFLVLCIGSKMLDTPPTSTNYYILLI